MQVSRAGSDSYHRVQREEETRPPPLRFPGCVDQVPGCLRLSEDPPVVPTLADFGVDAGGRARH